MTTSTAGRTKPLTGQEFIDSLRDGREVWVYGERVKDDVMLLLLNGYWEDMPFMIPGKESDPNWDVLVDTIDPKPPKPRTYRCCDTINLKARSFVRLRQPS